MTQIVFIFFIVLFSDLARAKMFQRCEFAKELYLTHEIPRRDIYKHLCISEYNPTNRNAYGFLGIYAIGEKWWCGQDDEPGGLCKVKCSNLLDDDIADDVTCAKQILRSFDLKGWEKSEDDCRESRVLVEDCLKNVEFGKPLLRMLDNLNSIVPPISSAKAYDEVQEFTVQ